MTDFIEGLGQELVAAARRQAADEQLATERPGGTPTPDPGRGRRRLHWPVRTVLVAILLSTTTATAAAAATLYTLRGSVIPAPAAQDVPATQTPVPGSAQVSPLRVADPRAGVAPWSLRIARSDTGYVCSTIGQVVDGKFGLVGLDGRFRTLDPKIADSCGQEQQRGATLIGARVLAGKDPADVRTIVNGVAGPQLRRVEMQTSNGTRAADVDPEGRFVGVLAGYPENVGLRVTLTFADGHRQTESFGDDPDLVLDPKGGNAWRTQMMMASGDARTCASFTWARSGVNHPSSSSACGDLGQDGRKVPRKGFFFAVRRLSGGQQPMGKGSAGFGGHWHGAPARTAVWGGVGDDVQSVTVLGGPGGKQSALIKRGNAILAVFPGGVSPDKLRVRVTMKDGRTVTERGDTNLVDHRIPMTITGARK